MRRQKRVVVTIKPASQYYSIEVERKKLNGEWEVLRPAKLLHSRRLDEDKLGNIIAGMLKDENHLHE